MTSHPPTARMLDVLSREVALVCDTAGTITWADARAESLLAALDEKAESLQRSAEVKSRVVANVSHEFRTPLHSILGLSKVLLNPLNGPLSAEQEKQVQFIRTSAEALYELVNDLLASSPSTP